MDLFVKYLIYDKKISSISTERWRRNIKPIILYEVFVVLGILSSRVDSQFQHEDEINTKLFETLMMFRDVYYKLLKLDQALWIEIFDFTETTLIIDDDLKSQFQGRFLYMPCGFYYSECRKKFFDEFANNMKYFNIDSVVQYIFDDKIFMTVPKFHNAYCINLILLMVKDISVTSKIKFHQSMWYPRAKIYQDNYQDISCNPVLILFSSLVQLCYENAFLAEHIWMHLFPGIWEMLQQETKVAILHSNDTEAYIKKISTYEPNSLPYPFDGFINAAVKENPKFCLYVDEKYIKRSFSFQVIASRVLEKEFFSQSFSSKNHEVNIKMLIEIYANMEETDLYYCFNKYYIKHTTETKTALNKFQNSEVGKSYKHFKKLLFDFRSGNYADCQPSEKTFCENEFIKCMTELSKWDFIEPISTSTSLNEIQIFSKWNIKESGFLTLNSMRNFSKDYIDCSFKDKVHTKCLETWKRLPCFYNRQHYSLLELTQEITELTEAWNTEFQLAALSEKVRFFNEKMLEICNPMMDTFHKWQERSYLLSDDYQFLTEIFHIRLAFLNFFHTKFSAKINDHSLKADITPAFRSTVEFAKNELNETLVELCSVALNHRNIHMKNLRIDNCSDQNMSSHLRLKLLSLLHDIGPSSNLESVSQEKIEERIDLLSELSVVHLDLPDAVPCMNVNVLNIWKEHGFGVKTSEPHLLHVQVHIAKLYEKLCVQHENNLNPGQIMETTAELMKSLLCICKYGDSINILPKVLHMLEFDDKDCLLPKVLQTFKIPARNWLPFLPFLVSRLLHALNAEEENPIMEVDGETNPSLSFVLSNLLIEIGTDYPQDVFLSLYSLKEMDKSCQRNAASDDPGEDVCISCTDVGKKRCKRIISCLKNKYPSLISHLEELMRLFKTFGPTTAERDHCTLKKLLEEVYCSLYENLKNENVQTCPAELISYLKASLKPLFENPDIKEDDEISKVISRLDESTCSIKDIFNIFKEMLDKYSSLLNEKYAKRSFYLSERFPFLSKFHELDKDINVFGQSSFVDSCSQVKIQKFLPKVKVQLWCDHYYYKIEILGHNGQVYSFLIKEDLNKMERLKKLKCTQMLENMNVLFKNYVECAKRFFNMHLPRITSVNPHLVLMPYHDKMLLYQDILTYDDGVYGFSPHVQFTSSLLENPEAFHNFKETISCFKNVRKEVDGNLLKVWVENSYSRSSQEYYLFRKEFIKHISQLIASELFLNISMKNDLLVHQQTAVVNVCDPELNLKNVQNISLLLTPTICNFIGRVRLKEVAEKVFWHASCLKRNAKLIESYLYLLKKDYIHDKEKILYQSPKLILKKLDNLDRDDIEKIIRLSASTDDAFLVSPLMQLFY